MTDLSDAHTQVTGLKCRRVLITGGTTGIGRAIAVLLASEGARVHICGRNPHHLADALARIHQVGEGAGTVVDLADAEAVRGYVAEAKAWLGGLDVAVVNAAIASDALSETSWDDLRYAIDVDFAGYLLTAHRAAEAIEKGDIVLIGSMSAHVLGPSSTVYVGIKAGITGFSEALRRELGPKGIRVSLVEPGLTGSDMQEDPPAKQREKIAAETSLRAEDIAVGVHYLLTQPRRTVVQQLTIVPRAQGGE